MSSLAEPYIRAVRATSQYIGVTFSIAFGYDGSVGFVIPSCEDKMPRPEQVTRSDPSATARSPRGAGWRKFGVGPVRGPMYGSGWRP